MQPEEYARDEVRRRAIRQWLEEARGGDEAAVAALIDQLAPVIRLMAAARIRSLPDRREAAEDVAQEVLSELARELPRRTLADEASLRAFASRIVSNRIIDHVRARRVRRAFHSPPPADAIADVSSIPDLWNAVASEETSPSGRAARAELFDSLLTELHQMPERSRDAVILAYFDGLNTTEIGTRLGLSRTAAANVVVRATKELQRRWSRAHERRERLGER